MQLLCARSDQPDGCLGFTVDGKQVAAPGASCKLPADSCSRTLIRCSPDGLSCGAKLSDRLQCYNRQCVNSSDLNPFQCAHLIRRYALHLLNKAVALRRWNVSEWSVCLETECDGIQSRTIRGCRSVAASQLPACDSVSCWCPAVSRWACRHRCRGSCARNLSQRCFATAALAAVSTSTLRAWQWSHQSLQVVGCAASGL